METTLVKEQITIMLDMIVAIILGGGWLVLVSLLLYSQIMENRELNRELNREKK